MNEGLKTMIIGVLIVPVISMFIALLVCFVKMDMMYIDPNNWSDVARILTAFFTFIVTGRTLLFTLDEDLW